MVLLKDRSVANELTFISTHLPFSVEIIKMFKTQNVFLSKSFSLINKFKQKINIILGRKWATLKTKLNYIFSKDTRLKVLRKINNVSKMVI